MLMRFRKVVRRKASSGYPHPTWGFFCCGRGDPMAGARPKRKLTAIFSADVKGHSRLVGEDESATVKTLDAQ
jgi:hypothetical protein